MVRVVDELERLELVRRDSNGDRRVHALVLTERGDTEVRRYRSSIDSFEKSITSSMSKQERAQLLALLENIALSD